MSISVFDLGTAVSESLAASSNLDLTLSTNVPAGSLIVLSVSFSNKTGVGTNVLDQSGNSYSTAAGDLVSVTGGAAGSFSQVWYAYNSLALSSGNYIRFSNTGTVAMSAAFSVLYATNIQTASDPFQTTTYHGVTGSSASPTVTTAAAPAAGSLVLGVLTTQGNVSDSYTQSSGGFVTPPTRAGTTTGTVTPETIAGGYVISSGSNITFAPSITSRDFVIWVVPFTAAPVPVAVWLLTA